MANNRLYVVHRPTGFFLCLGKRLAHGWHGDTPDLNAFHQKCADAVGPNWNQQDDFVLCIEDDENAPDCRTNWRHEGDRIVFNTVKAVAA